MRNIHKSTPSSFRRGENAAAIVKAPPPGALTKGPDRKFPGLHPPLGGATSHSLSTNRRFAFPILALLAALAVGLLFLLPGGLLQAQESATIMYPENGTEPVATFTAVDPEGKDIVWSLGGDDASDFKIEGGVLTFAKSPDYESPVGGGGNNLNTYTVIVQASDGRTGAAAMDTVTVTVTVDNVDEDGTVTLTTLQPVDGKAITATLTDPDGTPNGTPEWQWANSDSADGPFTNIEEEEAEAETYIPVPADKTKFLRATVTYTDSQGADKTAQVVSANAVLAARSANTAPVFEDEQDDEIGDGVNLEREVAENTPAGELVGDPVAATDKEGDILTYVLSGTDAGSFTIDVATGQLRTKAPLNFEMKLVYEVTVRATDPFTAFATAAANPPDANADTIGVEITVTNVKEAPTFSTGATEVVYLEPIAQGPTLDVNDVAYTAVDAEDDAAPNLTLSGADSGKFDLSEIYILTFKAAPNFESPVDANEDNAYEVSVVATDSDGQTSKRDVIITVTNMDEPGVVALSAVQPRIGVPITATLTDPDGDISDLTWLWSSTGGTGTIAEDDSKSATYTPVTNDLNALLTAMASYTDGQGSVKTASVTLEQNAAVVVDNRNRAPAYEDLDTETDGRQTDQTREVQENTAAAMPVGAMVTAVDPNSGDSLTYTLGGDDAASFAIDVATGQLMTKGELNREVKDAYTVTVTATDSYGLSATVKVTIKVINVDEAPELSGPDTASYAENGTDPVATYTATDDEDDKTGTALTWTLTGVNGGEFDLEEGVLAFKKSPDFETPAANTPTNEYMITVTVTDSNNDTGTLDVTVTVINVDEAGTVTLSTLQPVDGVEMTASLVDLDEVEGDPDWKWAKSNSRTCDFTDVVVTMATYTPDTVGMYVCAMATYTDGQGSNKTKDATSAYGVLEQRSTNVVPEFQDSNGDEIAGAITREVPENTAKGQPVGAPVVATDPEGDRLTYTLDVTGAMNFDINVATGQLLTKVALDTEADDGNVYTAMVTATDPYIVPGDGMRGSDTIAVTVTVADVEEDPVVTGEASVDVEEGMISVATYTGADDEDEAAPAFTLEGIDSDKFAITSPEGVLTFKAAPNFESPGDRNGDNDYQVRLKVTDSNDQADTLDVTVTVTNVEEDGVVTLSSVQPRIGVPITATLTDPDGDISDVTWKWQRGDADIRGATSDTYTPVFNATDDAKDDVDKILRAIATYSDGHDANNTAMADSTNMVIADTENKAPEFPDQDDDIDGDQLDQEITIAENSPADGLVGDPVVATDFNHIDAESPDLSTYTLGGGDADSFSIARGLGQITLSSGTKLDYETKDTYMVEVTATDSYGASATITVTIKVTDVNEPPTISRGGLAISGNSNPSYAEGRSDAVETYRASGPESGNAMWTLSGDDASAFSLSNDGMLTFRSSPDYENPMDADMDNVYMVTIMADDGTYMAMRNVTVNVTNMDEMGEVTLWAGTVALTMAPQVGDTITGLVVDPDGGVTGEMWQWSRTMDTADMSSWMPITGATDAAYMVTAGDTGYYLRVMATYTDAAGTDMAMEDSPATMMVTAMMTVPMFDSETATREVAENTEARMDIGDPVTGTDADGDTLIYALGGTDAGSFYIDPETGQLKTLAALDYETKATYSVMVTATDPDSASDMITVTITVTNVDEMGEVTLWAGTDPLTMAPQVGDTITGAVMDPDGNPGDMLPIAMDTTINDVTWQWARTTTPAMMESWMPITGATDAAYMVTAGDMDYYLRVMATYTDAAGTDMEDSPATMMVTAMMTVPMFDSETATREVAENTEASMDIGDPVMGTDADGDTLIYALGGTDAGSFYIDPETGQLKTLAALDYETKATYSVMVTATDPDSASDMITVTVTVTNVDEPGMVTLWASPTEELTMAPQVGDTITGLVVDPDGSVTGQMWQWSRTMDTADMSSWMEITDATEAAYMVTADDEGYYLRVMATYTDAAGTDTAMVYSMPTMMVAEAPGGTELERLIARYDTSGNDNIEKGELFDAINDYLFGPWDSLGYTKAGLFALINEYLF